MTGTFTIPGWGKIRTTTRRRYLLIGYYTAEQATSARWPAGPFAAGFTDNLFSARRRAASRYKILDTHTGEVVR